MQILSIESPVLRSRDKLMQFITQQLNLLDKKYAAIQRCDIIFKSKVIGGKTRCFARVQLRLLSKTISANEQGQNFRAAIRKVMHDLDSRLPESLHHH